MKESALGPENASLVPLLRAYATLLRKTQEYALAEKAEVRAMGIQVRNTLRP